MSSGRPKDHVEDRLPEGWQQRFLEMAAEGCSEVEIRAEFRISTDLWYRWLEEDETFSKTAKEAKDICHGKWESMGRKMAFGDAEGNPTTWIFNMKNRFGWKDKQEVEHSGSIQFSNMTDEDLDKKIAELAQQV